MTTSKAKTFRNIVYVTAGKGATLLCIGVTSSVVARNLSSSDYGLVGFATIIMSFLAHFSDVGVGAAAIRRPTLDQLGLRTAYTLKIILSTLAFLAAFLIAPFAHHFFQHPATANVIRVLAFDFLTSTIGFMSLVMLIREQNYRAMLVPATVSTLVRSILAITLILFGWKYWAVIAADVGSTLIGAITMQFMRRIPIRLEFDLGDAREFLRFGLPLLGGGVLVFLTLNIDNFLVGVHMGSAKLGYYALAFTWGSFICGLLTDTVNNVLFPAFSAIQNDTVSMRRWYLKTVDLVGFIAVIANTALLANTHSFLVSFLGKGTVKWLPAATALRILCVYGIVRVLTEPLANCIMVRGRTGILLRAAGLAGTIELLMLLLVLRTGRIELVAGAVLVAYVTQIFIYLPYLRQEFSISFGDLVIQLWPLIPAVAGGWALTSLLPDWLGGSLFMLGCRGLFTATVVALIHGLCTRFRCFAEASGMISQNFVRVRT